MDYNAQGDAHQHDRLLAQAEGLERFLRERTVDFINRLVVAVLILGGLATAASSSSRRAMLVTALVSLALGLGLALASTSRYLAVRRRLRRDPEREIARLRKHANARLRYFLGDVKTA